MLHHMALQLLFPGKPGVVLQAEFIGLCLAYGAVFPSDLRTFVASDMDVFGREKVHDFKEYIVEEF